MDQKSLTKNSKLRLILLMEFLAAEYQKVQDALDIIHKKEEKKQKEASVKQKKEHNILFKIACLCGLIG
jgi:hypothetical protein